MRCRRRGWKTAVTDRREYTMTTPDVAKPKHVDERVLFARQGHALPVHSRAIDAVRFVLIGHRQYCSFL